MFYPEEMGARIREMRKKRGVTQEQLAGQLGLSVSFMGHLERGTRAASLETLIALADLFGVSTDYLLRGDMGKPLTVAQSRALRELSRAFDQEGWLSDYDEK